MPEGGGAALSDLARRPEVVAVGETGLDFHYDRSPRGAQRAAFRAQIRLAREVDLPLIVHSREAPDETLAILVEEGIPPAGGVFHCFTYGPEMARRVLDLGLHLSFSGIITFPKAAGVRDAAALAPADQILVETDSPYLSPEPHRGKRNEPARVARVAEVLAEIRRISLDDAARLTTENARRLFRWPA